MIQRTLKKKADMVEALDGNGIPYEFLAVPLVTINDAPTIEARPVVRGEWLDIGGNPVQFDKKAEGCPTRSCYCSVCNDWLTASDEYPAKGWFCPNCGADMRTKEGE